jgi:hypothetical protein
MPLPIVQQPGQRPDLDRQLVAEECLATPVLTSNGSLLSEPGTVDRVIATNTDAAARTFQIFDDIVSGTTVTSPLTPLISVPPGQTLTVPLRVPTALGARVAAGSWVGLSLQGYIQP